MSMEDARKGITDAKSRARLEYWRAVVERDKDAWSPERDKMDWREKLYAGTKELRPVIEAEEPEKDKLKCYHVRNVVAENIESMVDIRVPKPKVIPLSKQDESLARSMEQQLKFWADRIHVEVLNDMAERMGPIQGGVFWLVEWDDSVRTPDGPGDVKLSILHPKQVIPQAGIYGRIEDMDHVCVMIPMTVRLVWERYGVDVKELSEEETGARGQDGETATAEEIVTVYQLFYRNGRGGIGNLVWTGDVVLCDREDYQARRLLRCKNCGAVASYVREPELERKKEMETAGQLDGGVRRCLWCEGTEFEETEISDEILMPGQKTDYLTDDGKEIHLEPTRAYVDPATGRLRLQEGDKIPYYKPDLFPLKLQKNISAFGKLLGESDVDKMADAQNLVKRLDKIVIDRLCKAGTITALPSDVKLKLDKEQGRVYRVDDAAKLNAIRTFNLSGDISSEVQIEARAYEEARQASGVTDSMQGRRDPTASSAKAKEYSASKAEGRMESRRMMKKEAWSEIYEMAAKLFLAYADESRRVRVELPEGGVDYKEFNRRSFLKVGRDGGLYYEDGFIFTCDDATAMGDSREAMWKEINASFAAGTLGNPQEIETRILYWTLMEEQCYPGAADIKTRMEEMRNKQLEAQAAQAKQAPPEASAPMGGAGMPAGM